MGTIKRVAAMGTAIGALLMSTAAFGATSNADSPLPPAVVAAKRTGAAVDPRLVASNNAFGLNLFKALVLDHPDNVAISPLSVSLALQIVYNGAAGATQRAMRHTLQLGELTADEINNANAALQASLINPEPQVQLTIANSLWMHLTDNSVVPSFTQTNKTYYGSTVGDLSGAPDNINAWVARATDGLITEILSEPPSHYASVAAVIANAIYFKGRWSNPFDANETGPARFTLRTGEQVPCQMMHRRGDYGYLQGANFQAIRLPYGQHRLSMVIVLPNRDVSLSSFVADMTADKLTSWIAQFKQSYGAVALPRFKSSYDTSLRNPLTSLGMGVAFSEGANFSGIAPHTDLSEVAHEAVVAVDEIGTVAAAATAAEVVVTSARREQFTMTMDHPFFYAIRDDHTEALLFVGALASPK